VPRSRGGRKLAPQIQRMLAADLLASVFPDAAACLENIPGDRQIPDHPLVSQTVRDCLEEAMDLEGLRAVLTRIHRGELRLVARDTPEPSVFAREILNARPYAFLDDAPLEERRSHAVQTRRGADASSDDLGTLDPAAIDRVRDEARPDPRTADELHDDLMTAGFLLESDFEADAAPWSSFVDELAAGRRACRARLRPGAAWTWIAAERLPELLAVHADPQIEPRIQAPASRARAWQRDEAILSLLRGRLTLTGPTTAVALAESLSIEVSDADAALLALEGEGVILRGRFTQSPVAKTRASDSGRAAGAERGHWAPAPRQARGVLSESKDASDGVGGSGGAKPPGLEWCDRTLLARIHRYTLNRLRAEIEPVTPADFMRFLFRWQHVDASDRLTGLDGLREAIAALDGFELAAGAWERSVLPARVIDYDPSMLDLLCLTGEVGWARFPEAPAATRISIERTMPEPPRLSPATPIALFLREHGDAWRALGEPADEQEARLGDGAKRALSTLRARGASFFTEVRAGSGLDAEDARVALGSLVACGLAVSDGFAGLRALMRGGNRAPARHDRRATFSGRWTLVGGTASADARDRSLETQAWALLRRYGVVFRRLLTRESRGAPWRDLARVYRRLEARGEIRGGRFVSGMSGEQFALPQAVERMREVRRTPSDGRLLAISGADPLNLAGIITSGDRVRAAGRSRLVYRDGIPLAALEGDLVRELAPIDPSIAEDLSRALRTRRPAVRVA
jgi:ATP-dependent Lhr-like helicase